MLQRTSVTRLWHTKVMHFLYIRCLHVLKNTFVKKCGKAKKVVHANIYFHYLC